MVKTALASALALALALPAMAQQELGIKKLDIDSIAPEVLEQAKQISEQGRAATDALQQTEDMTWVKSLAENIVVQEAQRRMEADQPKADPVGSDQQPNPEKKHPLGDGHRTLIFVSFSMGDQAIMDLMSLYDGQAATGIVFRGIPKGVSMADAVTRMHRMTQETQSTVSVLLDPLAFQRHGINLVPAVAIETPEDKLVAKVTGISSVEYLQDAIAEGKKGDLGIIGQPIEISEPDLMAVAQQRMEELDYDAMKKRAISRFWDVHTGHFLPAATEPARRLVDASVLIPQDILDNDGKVVTPAGRINPLAMRRFDQKLVVIDPTKPWQVELAKREKASAPLGVTVSIMASQIPSTSGWELFNATQDSIDAPLFLLQPDMASRFGIERVPSVVTADDSNFIVTEFTEASALEVAHANP
jgi:conjugal transfer pilus assembly protein TraW